MHTKAYFVSLALILKRQRALAMVCKGKFSAYWQHNLFWQTSVNSDGGSHLRFHIFHSHGCGGRNISIIFENLPSTLPLLGYYFVNDIFGNKKNTDSQLTTFANENTHFKGLSLSFFIVDFRAEMGLQKDLHLRESTGTAQVILIVLFQDLRSKQF